MAENGTDDGGETPSADDEREPELGAEEAQELLGFDASNEPTTFGQMLTEMVISGSDQQRGRATDADEELREEVRRFRDEVHDARRELVRLADGVERIADALEE